MPWKVSYDPEQGFIEEVYCGVSVTADFHAAIAARISLEQKTGSKKILVDLLAVELSINTIEIFGLPNKYYPEVKAPRSSCIALLVSSDERVRKAAKFFETACVNRGWNVQIFSERKSAVEWLAKKKT